MSACGRNVLRETGLRRKNAADIRAIQTQITAFGTEDELSRVIQQWLKNFQTDSQSNRPPGLVRERYQGLLPEILVGAIQMAALDEKALLGSDGRSYGYKMLCIHLCSVQEPYRSRSPVDRNNQAPFTVKPHKTARYLVKWLKKDNAMPVNRSVETAFARLSEGQLERILPTEENNRWRRYQQMQRSRQRWRQEADQELAEIRGRVQALFVGQERQIAAVAGAAHERLDEQDRRNQAALAEARQRIQVCEQEIQELDRDIANLEQRLEEQDRQLSQAEREQAELELRIAKVEKAAKERKKGMLTTALIVVAAVAASYFLGPGMMTIMAENQGASLAVAIAL